MVETCVAPSELHLKRELTALQKARFLRDPETCSSWRSPLSSKSLTTSCHLKYGNGSGRNSGDKGMRRTPEMPPRESMRKNVYLYNWKNHCSKSCENGIKLDGDDRQVSIEETLGESFSSLQKEDSTRGSFLEATSNVYNVGGANPGPPVRRGAKKIRSAISTKQAIKHSAVTKLLDLSSASLGVLNSVEQSDDTEYCNSEDLQLTHVITNKTAYRSTSVSPLFSGSGCGNWSYSSKFMRNTRNQGSSRSCTPVSTSSYYRCGGQNTSIVGSWDGTATSVDDDLDQLDLQRNQGCGIPCYWRKKTKDRGGFCSPSLSDTLRKGTSLFCGSQTSYKRKNSSSHKKKHLAKFSQGFPLLSNSGDGGNSSSDTASDELSTNLGELELEALSRLDGRRWSGCKSQEGLQSVSAEGDTEAAEHKTLSQKYSPRSFDEIIGQNIVIHSLNSAILRGRIAPAYLFLGPRGTGKTTTARIFAAALNCLSTEENKPCGFCRECISIFSGNGSNVREVDAINKKGVDRVRYLLKNISVAKTVSRYKVFIIDECHMLSSRVWSAFMNFLQEPVSHIVFIFITIDPENLPRAIISRCQKYLFSKVKDADIVGRLKKLSYEENLDIELDALDLIALNSDGSLRDAETMLEQWSLLGKRITTSLVNELIGVVSDEKLLDLLEVAMSSDTAETVKRSRELMDSGVDPMALMSQLAGLIMDIIAGTDQLASSESTGIALGEESLSEDELKRLQQALKILSDAEKQLKLSSERSTWFTAALLQLGSGHNMDFTQSSGSSKNSTKETHGALLNMTKDSSFSVPGLSSAVISRATSRNSSPQNFTSSYKLSQRKQSASEALPASIHSGYKSLDDKSTDSSYRKKEVTSINPDKLSLIWRRCIQGCESEALQQLLGLHGKLASITENGSALTACIVFEDVNVKSRIERYLGIIRNSFETFLQCNVEVSITGMLENHSKSLSSMPDSASSNHTGKGGFSLAIEATIGSNSSKVPCSDRRKACSNLHRKSRDCPVPGLRKTLENGDSSSVQDDCLGGASFIMLSEGKDEVMSALKKHIDEDQQGNTLFHGSDDNSLELANHSNTNGNQVLPQIGFSCENHKLSSVIHAISSKHWEDELNRGIKDLEISVQRHHKEQPDGYSDHCAISPSLLHSNGFNANTDKDNLGYESGTGCSGLFCWQPCKPNSGKVKDGIHGQSPKARQRFRCLGSVRGRRSREAS